MSLFQVLQNTIALTRLLQNLYNFNVSKAKGTDKG